MTDSVGTIYAGGGNARTAARDVLAAVIFREVLQPLAKALGPAGDVAVATVVDGIFVRHRP
jgi:hypothetical protein